MGEQNISRTMEMCEIRCVFATTFELEKQFLVHYIR